MKQDLFWHKLLYSGFRYDFENVYSSNVTVNFTYFLLIFLRATTNEQALLLKLVRQPRFFNLSILCFSFFLYSCEQQASTSLTIWATNSLFIPHYLNEMFCLYSYTNDRDDPRFPTVRGVLRRGMTVEGLREFIVLQVGTSNRTSRWIWHSVCCLFHKVVESN